MKKEEVIKDLKEKLEEYPEVYQRIADAEAFNIKRDIAHLYEF